MTQRNLQKIEEQIINIAINGTSFRFRFYAFRNLMYVDVVQGEVEVINGQRVMANQWILPEYIAEGIGNLRFETYDADSNEYVWYEGFNLKFRLISYTDREIKEMEAAEEVKE